MSGKRAAACQVEGKPFAKNLCDLMKEHKENQKELAEKLGVKQQTISYYRNGQSIPDAENLIKIAKHYGVTTDFLLGLTDVRTTNTDLKAVCEYTGLSETAIKTMRDLDEFCLYTPILDYFIEIENESNPDDSLCLFSNIWLFVSNLAKNNHYFFYEKGDFVKSDSLVDMPLSFNSQEVLDRICIDKITGALFKARDVLKRKYDEIIRG